jgi:hypothetical protein
MPWDWYYMRAASCSLERQRMHERKGHAENHFPACRIAVVQSFSCRGSACRGVLQFQHPYQDRYLKDAKARQMIRRCGDEVPGGS